MMLASIYGRMAASVAWPLANTFSSNHLENTCGLPVCFISMNLIA